MTTKICTKCKLELPIEEFHWRNKAAGTRRSECKSCHNLMAKKDYDRKRNQMIDAKIAIGSCQKCGYSKCIESLDFHHKNPNEKEYTISQMIRQHKSQLDIEEEMKKCIILCANCHREFHYLERLNGITIDEFLFE